MENRFLVNDWAKFDAERKSGNPESVKSGKWQRKDAKKRKPSKDFKTAQKNYKKTYDDLLENQMEDKRFITNDWSKWNQEHHGGGSSVVATPDHRSPGAIAAPIAKGLVSGAKSAYGKYESSFNKTLGTGGAKKTALGSRIKGGLRLGVGGAIGGAIAGSFVHAPGAGAAIGAGIGSVTGLLHGDYRKQRPSLNNQYIDERFIK